MLVGLAFLAPACCSPTLSGQPHARAGKGVAFLATACVRQLHQRHNLADLVSTHTTTVIALAKLHGRSVMDRQVSADHAVVLAKSFLSALVSPP